MKQKALRTFFLSLVLTLGWTAQAFALACEEIPQKNEITIKAHDGHGDDEAHSMPNCHGCEKGEAQHQASAQCLKNLEKSSAFSVAQKLKVETVKAVPSEFLDFRSRKNQIRGPDVYFNPTKSLKNSLISLHIRLQV